MQPEVAAKTAALTSTERVFRIAIQSISHAKPMRLLIHKHMLKLIRLQQAHRAKTGRLVPTTIEFNRHKTPDPSIERTSAGKPVHAPHLER